MCVCYICIHVRRYSLGVYSYIYIYSDVCVYTYVHFTTMRVCVASLRGIKDFITKERSYVYDIYVYIYVYMVWGCYDW